MSGIAVEVLLLALNGVALGGAANISPAKVTAALASTSPKPLAVIEGTAAPLVIHPNRRDRF